MPSKVIQELEFSPAVFAAMKALGRFCWFCTMNARIAGAENLTHPAPYLLACNHGNHADPLVLGAYLDFSVDWMTRKEFFRYAPLAWLIRRLGGFCVNRQGVPVSAIRTAVHRLETGRIVGVFPEGGVANGKESVCCGGTMKQGVCLIACLSDVPIIPCVIVGSQKLSSIGPWLPFRRAHVWIAFGKPLQPPSDFASRKARRKALAALLQQEFIQLHKQVIADFAINDTCE